jgi:hypothetical protein
MRLFSLLTAALLGADAVRVRRQGEAGASTKFIEGVPILNYNLAYEGASLSEAEKSERKNQRWVVVVRSHLKQRLMKKLCQKITCTKQGNPEKGGVPFFEVEACEGTLKKFLGSKFVKKIVKFIEPESQARAIPEMEAKQDSASWGLDRIGAPKRANEGLDVHIYVLDTGVRNTHDDFGGRVVPTLDMSSDAPVECTGEKGEVCTNDAQGHGTHCAGTTAGEKYGVAPAATVHAVKVLSDEGGGSWSWSYTALDWIATKGERPAVASMSLGGAGTQSAMSEAVTAAVDAGVTVVVAGGNENQNACNFSPAFVPAAITVGSSTSKDVRSSFSNYGACTDIWAPGSDITSAAHNSDDGAATFSGTSMACPHVSGASALVLEKEPTWLGDQVLEQLLNFAIDGALTDLKSGDTNRLLYVGEDAVPAPPIVPTPAPPPPPAQCVDGCQPWMCDWLEACAGCCGGLVEDKVGKGGKGGKKARAKADC